MNASLEESLQECVRRSKGKYFWPKVQAACMRNQCYLHHSLKKSLHPYVAALMHATNVLEHQKVSLFVGVYKHKKHLVLCSQVLASTFIKDI